MIIPNKLTQDTVDQFLLASEKIAERCTALCASTTSSAWDLAQAAQAIKAASEAASGILTTMAHLRNQGHLTRDE